MTLPIPLPPVTMATLSASLPNSLPPVCSPTALTGVHPTVHRDGLRRDERIGDERQDGFRDLLRATQPPNRNASGELPARLIIARQRLPTLDERGGHGVHRDPVGCERTGQCVHEADKAGLRGRVVGTHDPAGESGNRGDKHHSPPLPPAHPRCEPFGEKEGGPEIHIHHPVPVLDRYLLQALLWSYASVADQYVYRPKLQLDDIDHLLQPRRVANVALDRHDSSTHPGDTRGLLLGGRPVVRVTDRDIRPGLRQPPGYGGSNPTARPRHQSYTPAKIHSSSLPRVKEANL